MKLKDKNIAFGLTSVLYAFKDTIIEMQNISKQGGKIIPIMQADTYNANNEYRDNINFIKDIEEISGRKVICEEEAAGKVEADIMVIAPCSR